MQFPIFFLESILCFFSVACLIVIVRNICLNRIRNYFFCFINLERTSKRNRILDFFRGRSRAADRTDNHNIKDRDHSQVTLIDKTSMK